MALRHCARPLFCWGKLNRPRLHSAAHPLPLRSREYIPSGIQRDKGFLRGQEFCRKHCFVIHGFVGIPTPRIPNYMERKTSQRPSNKRGNVITLLLFFVGNPALRRLSLLASRKLRTRLTNEIARPSWPETWTGNPCQKIQGEFLDFVGYVGEAMLELHNQVNATEWLYRLAQKREKQNKTH